MTLRVGINGFGRIGRLVFRAAMESGRKDLEFVAINDLGSAEANARLLKYDSVHGAYPGKISSTKNTIKVGNKSVRVLAERDPADLPWGESGRRHVSWNAPASSLDKEKRSAHLTPAQRRSWSRAPASGRDMTVVYGVNHTSWTPPHRRLQRLLHHQLPGAGAPMC